MPLFLISWLPYIIAALVIAGIMFVLFCLVVAGLIMWCRRKRPAPPAPATAAATSSTLVPGYAPAASVIEGLSEKELVVMDRMVKRLRDTEAETATAATLTAAIAMAATPRG